MPQIPPARSGREIVAYSATQQATLDLHHPALLGITGKPGTYRALIRDTTGAVQSLRYGDLSAAGIVMEIEAKRAVFSQAGREVVLTLAEL